MIARMGSGWQVVLADLSMILFMITAAGVADAPPEPHPQPAAKPITGVPALGEPVAQWRADAGGPSLGEWLRLESADPRMRLTIMASLDDAPAALALAREAGRPARVVLDPEGGGAPLAALTYDQGEPAAVPVKLSKETVR